MIVVRNPYSGVDWATYGRYKGCMHAHTTNSDGTQAPSAVIDEYDNRRYDILAITDHDNLNSATPTWPWTTYGRDPGTLGMLAVQANEFSAIEHANGFFSDLWTQAEIDGGTFTSNSTNLPWIFNEVGSRGGKLQINHPGRYAQSDQYYIDLFNAYNAHLHGIEIFNQGDRYPGDRARWDNLLTSMRNSGGTYGLWGHSTDDSHQASHVGRNYHVYLMPDLSENSLKIAMATGAFYVVYDPLGNTLARHDDSGTGFWVAAPMLTGVTVTGTSITLTASQATSTEWFTSGGASIETGMTLSLDTPGLSGYARAVMTGADGAVTYTQPFYLGGNPATGALDFRIAGLNKPGTLYIAGEPKSIVEVRRPSV